MTYYPNYEKDTALHSKLSCPFSNPGASLCSEAFLSWNTGQRLPIVKLLRLGNSKLIYVIYIYTW
jgi:hypothetical protein